MSTYFSVKTKTLVRKRAKNCCEYCRLKEEDSFLRFQIEHIVSIKHGGGNELENLALACPHCNRYKGTDLTTFLDSYDDIVPLFNPRKQNWNEHFSIQKGEILAKSRVGAATIKLLRMNVTERVEQRRILGEI